MKTRKGPACSYHVLCIYVMGISLVFSVKLLTVEVGIYLTLLPSLKFIFLPGCLVQPQYDGFYNALVCLALSYLPVASWRPALF